MYNLSFAAYELANRGLRKTPTDVDSLIGPTVTDTDVPGKVKLGELIETIRTYSIIACVIAIIIAAVLWAWGSQSQNAAQATQGKKGVIVAIAAAALIFAAEALINWGIEFGEGFS